nr:hypothetical protein GCM10020092_097330 [Actinoplanes digitatis]
MSVTVWTLPSAGPTVTVHPGGAEMTAPGGTRRPAGRVTVMVGSAAVDGPLLVTVAVTVPTSPVTAMTSSVVSVICMSAA